MLLTTTSLTSAYDRALDGMGAVAARLDADQLNERPHGDGTNSVAALVVHCAAVIEFWFGHVALGRPSTRDRDSEFSATATHQELEDLLAAARALIEDDLAAIQGGRGGSPSDLRLFLPGDGGDDEVVLKVIEELFQHLGHMELAADAVLASAR